MLRSSDVADLEMVQQLECIIARRLPVDPAQSSLTKWKSFGILDSFPMPTRLAAILALLVFAVCLLVGGVETGNTFTTTVGRALAAMAGTFVIGLVIGSMGQRMIDENLTPVAKETEAVKDLKAKKPSTGR
jgi:hypothetical protein